MLKTASIAAFALAATFAAHPVIAQDTRSVAVHYGDLDLTSARGVARLHSRVAAALSQVCGFDDARSLSHDADIARCRSAATIAAHRQFAAAIARARPDALVASR